MIHGLRRNLNRSQENTAYCRSSSQFPTVEAHRSRLLQGKLHPRCTTITVNVVGGVECRCGYSWEYGSKFLCCAKW
ncbi:hypothetical protein SESBI_01194 [Sesbania bispinosa]|nr:hypothetical protein SESBI_01194 [Sesbania bispinosa]